MKSTSRGNQVLETRGKLLLQSFEVFSLLWEMFPALWDIAEHLLTAWEVKQVGCKRAKPSLNGANFRWNPIHVRTQRHSALFPAGPV